MTNARRDADTDAAITVTVARIGGLGDGVAEHDGRPVFIPFTAPGDRVRVRLAGRRGDGFAGRVVALIAAGPERREPPCRHFGTCGGCALQHLGDDAYRGWKLGRVRDALARHGLGAVPVAPVVATPPGDRRRATLAARRVGDRAVLGFNERRRHRIVDLAECPVMLPQLAGLLPALRQTLGAVLRPGEAAEVQLTALDEGADVTIVAERAPDLAARERLAGLAVEADLARLSWREGRSPPEPVAQRRPATVTFGGVPVAVPSGAFLQASRAGETALVRLVCDGVGGASRIADLFAGLGTFTFPLAGRARVLAVDSDGAALDALVAAARRSGLADRIEARSRNLNRDPVRAAELDGFEAVVFDPPRAGAAAQAAELARASVPAVVGVSCHPSSFARDAATLVGGGYRLESVTPVDQFLWSGHVELVGVFRRGR